MSSLAHKSDAASTANPPRIAFDRFELDLRSGELRKDGRKIRLQSQPFQLLALLLENAGEVVTRDEVCRKLWRTDTYVDFDHSVAAAVNKIREALADSAENPRFVETLPRRGYRFIGQVRRELPQPLVLQATTEPNAPGAGMTTRPASSPTHWPRTATWTAVGVVALLLLGLSWLRWRPRPEPAALHVVPFTSYPGMEYAPTFSPDGSRIAFAWDGGAGKDSSAGLDLYVKAIGSETLLRLTNHPSEWISAAWSPDGTQIALHRIAGPDTGIYLVPALGGPERKLRSTHVPYNLAAGISWSPDGKWLAYGDIIGGKPGDRIFLLSMETLESKQIPHRPECNHEANLIFQHKGDTLAFLCVHNESDFALYTFPFAALGGTPKLVAQVRNISYGITWSSDDKRLILNEEHPEGDWLYELALADGIARRIPVATDGDWPAVSPNGDRLAFSTITNHVIIRRRDLAQPDGPSVELIASTREQNFPQYSPDGQHLAFDSTRAGTWSVWVSDADGSNPVQISQDKPAGYPRWSPDSQKIAFEMRDAGRSAIYIADITERVPRKLVSNVAEMAHPYWSHDGKWIYFRSFEALGHKIYRCPASGGAATLIASALDATTPQESFDGKALYFMPRPAPSELRMVSLDGTRQDSAVAGLPPLADDALWAVLKDGIYFVPQSAPRTVAYFNFATKQVRDVFKLEKDFDEGLSVSPDGRYILFSQVDEQNSDIMLVEQFH
jgi:Tol biopolymer transport system component/DNA-binding winged helix-turn-helix (wHTH) protein